MFCLLDCFCFHDFYFQNVFNLEWGFIHSFSYVYMCIFITNNCFEGNILMKIECHVDVCRNEKNMSTLYIVKILCLCPLLCFQYSKGVMAIVRQFIELCYLKLWFMIIPKYISCKILVTWCKMRSNIMSNKVIPGACELNWRKKIKLIIIINNNNNYIYRELYTGVSKLTSRLSNLKPTKYKYITNTVQVS